MSIEVTNEIEVYESDTPNHVTVSSHSTDDNLVILQTGDGEYVVCGADLMAAIANATNTG